MNIRYILPIALTVAMTSVAAAQTSEITGTLTTGSSSGSTLSGTVTPPAGGGTLTGTVVSPSTGTGTGTTGGGGGGGGSGTNVIDICPNLAGNQSSLPAGYVLSAGNCVLVSQPVGNGIGTTITPTPVVTGTTNPGIPNTGGVAPTGASRARTPGIPNTGENGTASVITLIASALIALGGTILLRRTA